MKTRFKTISVGSLVLSYFAIMGICLLLYFIFGMAVPAVLFLILPVLLYFLFRGEVELEATGEKLLVTWIRKPPLKHKKDSAVSLNEIIRWKHETSFRGPEGFTVILKDGKKLRFRPAMFSKRDWYTELWVQLNKKMEDFHSNTSKEKLYDEILNSGYIKKLDRKIRVLNYFSYILIFFGLLSLLLMIPFGNYETTLSVAFVVLFGTLAGCTIFRHQLKFERKETLRK